MATPPSQPTRMRLGIQLQLIAATLLMVVPVLALSLFLYYQNGARALREEIATRLIASASITARMVSADDLAQVQSPQDEWSPAYRRLKNHLIAVRQQVEGVRYASILVPLSDDLKWRYLMDSDSEPDDINRNGITEPALEGLTHVGDPASDYDLAQFPVMQEALQQPTADRDFVSDQWGKWLSGYAPIKDAHGKTVALIAIDLSDRQVQREEGIMREIAWSVLAICLVLTLLLTGVLTRWLTRPIHRLAQAAGVVADGDLTVTVPSGRNDELGDLTHAFNRMTNKLVENQRKLVEGERHRSEMTIASRIQAAMLPEGLPPRSGLDLAASLRPATEVAGDYYDFLAFDAQTLGVIVADVNGHGLPSAILMAMLRACVHTHMLERESMPDQPSPLPVMAICNRMVHGAGKERRFATAVTALFDAPSRCLTYASAGHLPPYLYVARTKQVIELPVAQAYPLGVRPKITLTQQTRQLESGDLLLFYSDGLTEARSPVGEEFGFERMAEFMLQHAQLTAQAFHDKLLIAWEDWLGGLPPEDDLTVVVLKVTG